MSTKTIKIPGPDHPITIERNGNRVVVKLGDREIANSTNVLTLREASYPPVFYIPRVDVDMSLLLRSETTTYCPYKGEAAYYSIPTGGERSIDAIWTYEDPYDAVSDIRDHVAFYPSRVDAIEEVAT
ncbi:uncharacterized protein (DUF427 family) [Novosphingobium sp. PhB165]|uniref:DUF427 domain-containing protein n=1 Tax=Novosphingobium sp. PhB165 TaxID=2485105 RepID=UPI00104E8B3F|nr:DUF427 domain-containing protein [Novosphingobium sp. PhB165]TCM14232.1 uncharacterized protein (DUF427 family) [Novosphingobium sp. PhB165]